MRPSRAAVKSTGPPKDRTTLADDPTAPVAVPAKLSPAAAAFRAAYIAARTRYDTRAAGRPAPYAPPGRYDNCAGITGEGGLVIEKSPLLSVWEYGAKMLGQLGAHPDEYVFVQFEEIVHDVPEPPQLFTAPRVARWQHAVRNAGPKVAALYRGAEGAVRAAARSIASINGRSPANALLVALLDPGVDACPLYRYCIAAGCGPAFAEAAAHHYPAAVEQYRRHRDAYRANPDWCRILPFDFDDTVVRSEAL